MASLSGALPVNRTMKYYKIRLSSCSRSNCFFHAAIQYISYFSNGVTTPNFRCNRRVL